MRIQSIFCCMALLLAMQLNAQIHNVENFKGRITIPLKHGSDHPGKRTDEAMNRWRSHGLGQFIHWGVYAIPGGERNGKRMVVPLSGFVHGANTPKQSMIIYISNLILSILMPGSGLDRLKRWGPVT